jgi:glycosyltransferase involved in cell wall biosynthesis
MIYLDVTSAASSPVNMGVHRTVRGLYSHLKPRTAVTPLMWDFSKRRYSTLSPRELGYLESPFASYEKSVGTPGRWDPKFWLDSWKDYFSRGERGVPMETVLAEGNTLFVPDLCWDARIHSWKNMDKYPGRKIALLHDAMPMRLPGQADSNDKLFDVYLRELKHFDLVVCISQEVKEDLLGFWKKHAVEPKPIRVLPWPVPFESARPQNPPKPETKKVIYVARLKLRKNHLVLLSACEKLWCQGEVFSLDLIGIEDAFTDTRTILREMRRLAKLGRPVQWRKHISEAELAEAYRDCAFTAFPSKLEGFGLPIIESLWHGRPVICGRNGAIGEVAVGGGCHQIDQNNPDELANAIHLLLNDRAVYDRLCEEASYRAFRTWDDYGRDMDSVLKIEPAPVG